MNRSDDNRSDHNRGDGAVNAYDTAPRTRPAGRNRLWLVVTISLLGLTMVITGARQLTVQLTATDPGSAATPVTAERGATTAATSPAGPGDAAEQPPPRVEEDADSRITLGQVVIDDPYVHAPHPDLVLIAAATAGARAPGLPGRDTGGSLPRGGDRDDGDGGPGPGTLTGEADGTADRPIDGTVDRPVDSAGDLALDAGVETTGHFATVTVDIGDELSGLNSLRIDFGDGGVSTLDDRQIAELAASRRMSVVHEYEPTLTPQPRTVIVTAADVNRGTHERSVDFFTQAEYRLTYSALAVTALDDCDLVGKGDFTLTWRLDSRPARQNSFTLGKGDTHVESGFRIGLNGVRFGEPLAFFLVRVEENDSGPGQFTPEGFREFAGGAPVMELDNHHYDVTLHADDVENAGPAGSSLHWDCDVDMTFTVYLTMIDSPDRR